ncbi:isocitrate lyase/PEP mutase family protein [Spirillospora albida]|uniref:isocitrate lyase/PEP mutase family protein n=1 Tax=Spirillospora albida TaxID=58123 RepID=UPI0004BF80C4|nr:isocitrate lyase/phosphoenolpyruvate mutase family protein [Spirillospora albida]
MSDEFRNLHAAGRPLLLPNVWDYAGGAALARAGFAAIGTTSLGVAAAAGRADAAGKTRHETIALAKALVRLPVHVTVDIEGGFSTVPEDVAALVAELAGLGVAGVNLEDGRPAGALAPLHDHAEVLRAVKASAPGVFLNARIDTYWLAQGQPVLEETLRRVRAYANAGADGVFVPGIAADGDIRAVLDHVPLPLNVLYLPGRTDIKRLGDLGVHRISTGSLLFREALRAAVALALDIAGEDGGAYPVPSYDDVQDLIGG